MTNEEAINYLHECSEAIGDTEHHTLSYAKEALNMAIKALSQQTEDAISKQTVIGLIEYHIEHPSENFDLWALIDEIKGEPSVTPKQETAHWKWLRNDVVMCDKCGYVQTLVDFDEDKRGKNYCPSCGRNMEDEE